MDIDYNNFTHFCFFVAFFSKWIATTAAVSNVWYQYYAHASSTRYMQLHTSSGVFLSRSLFNTLCKQKTNEIKQEESAVVLLGTAYTIPGKKQHGNAKANYGSAPED